MERPAASGKAPAQKWRTSAMDASLYHHAELTGKLMSGAALATRVKKT